MSLPSTFLTTTCDIYRPFGAGAPTTTSVPCRLVPTLSGPFRADIASSVVAWTHYIDVDDTIDIRDACTRVPGINSQNYGDGDEVRIPNASGSRYVVVWVELHNRGTSRQFKRVYLMRDTAVWPDL